MYRQAFLLALVALFIVLLPAQEEMLVAALPDLNGKEHKSAATNLIIKDEAASYSLRFFETDQQDLV